MNICKCGCGQEIILKRHHRWSGIPDFIHGHNTRGRITTEYTRKLLSEQKRGEKNPSKDLTVRKKMRDKALIKWGALGYKQAHSGINAPMHGKHQTDEAKARARFAMLGENNPSWQGGISKFPYGHDWTQELKDSIRKRDGYTCQFCGISQKDLKEKLHVHHSDYNKENCNPDNLISLCRSCHTKTNFMRVEWMGFFKEFAKERMCVNA